MRHLSGPRIAGLLVVAIILCVIAANPFHRGHMVDGDALRHGMQIRDALNAYKARNGRYPDGSSSTEIFQLLLDIGSYPLDPSVFYIPFPGKVPPVPGKRLKPENVSWDVIAWPGPSTRNNDFPLVFITGAKVTFAAGANAAALTNPLPSYHNEHLTWYQWWNHDALVSDEGDLVRIFAQGGADGLQLATDGAFHHFIAQDFNPHGNYYVQLTPSGPLR